MADYSPQTGKEKCTLEKEITMTVQRKRIIFYFEDDVDCTQDIISVFNESAEYEVLRAAHWPMIKVQRDIPFDLVIIDLMIHLFSLDESGQEVENISYEDIPWQRTGVEFLRRIRQGEYEKYGFAKDVKVIVASAVVDQKAKQDTKDLKRSGYIEKPFTIEELQEVIRKVLTE
jgi:CheY-like chemotaxis protein